MAMSRKKATDLMVKAYSEKHPQILVRLMAEGLTAEAFFPHRERVIADIQRGKKPETVIDDVVDTVLRLHDIERRSVNSYVPQLRDVISPELRDELNRLN